MEQPEKTTRNPHQTSSESSFFSRLIQVLHHFFHNLKNTLRALFHCFHICLRRLKNRFLRARAKHLIPRLEPYRHLSDQDLAKKPADFPKNQDSNPNNSSEISPQNSPEFSTSTQNHVPNYPKPQTTEQNSPEIFEVEPFTPTSITEFLNVIKRTPHSILSARERHAIAAVINFPHTKVESIMLPPDQIVYVRDNEIIGPLTLDRLYQSGFQHFPVIDSHHKIVGLIHTTSFNNLEIKESSRADEILDHRVYYLRSDYTLSQALAAFLRTNCYFFLVIDRFERIVGMLTYQMIIDYLLGETPTDDFERDHDRLAVAKRKL